ncbi:MAG: hypothetical protein GX444_02695 [Myxococcales bacterium]|nr:hypothetical protein [Myxococcales bacterium]
MKLKKNNFILNILFVIFCSLTFFSCTEKNDQDSSGSCTKTVEVGAEADRFAVAANGSTDDCLPPKPDGVSEEDYQEAGKLLDLYTGLYENSADGTQLTMSCTPDGGWAFPVHYDGDGNAIICDSGWTVPVVVATEQNALYRCGLNQTGPQIESAQLICSIEGESYFAFRRDLADGGFEWDFMNLDLSWRKID